jgi:hypothetical protein
MRRLKLMIPAAGAAMVMLVGLAGPAGAGGKASIDPGRANSTSGLVNAGTKGGFDLKSNKGGVKALEEVTQNIVMAQDPDQPGVTPGGGGDCPTC